MLGKKSLIYLSLPSDLTKLHKIVINLQKLLNVTKASRFHSELKFITTILSETNRDCTIGLSRGPKKVIPPVHIIARSTRLIPTICYRLSEIGHLEEIQPNHRFSNDLPPTIPYYIYFRLRMRSFSLTFILDSLSFI